MHFFMGYLHPFVDGNGCTALAIFYWYLVRKGYWLIEYMSISRSILDAKAQYARAYLPTKLDDKDLTYIILYNLNAITRSPEELKKYIAWKTAEKANLYMLDLQCGIFASNLFLCTMQITNLDILITLNVII